jgi:serralysin
MTAPTPYTSSPVSSVSTASGDDYTNSLLYGVKWGGAAGTEATIYYSFPGAASVWNATDYYPAPRFDEPYNQFSATNSSQQHAAGVALQAWANVADLTLFKVTETSNAVGDIRIANTGGGDMNGGTFAYTYMATPAGNASGGDLWFNARQPVSTGNDYSTGAAGYNTMIHELGHALGLKHPFGSGVTLPSSLDTFKYTVMSYSEAPDQPDTGKSSFYPTTPMVIDIAAIQYLYGANMSYNTGDDVYVFSQGKNYYQTIWDAGGNDTIQYIATAGGKINLNAGIDPNAATDPNADYFSQLGKPIKLSNGTVQADTVAIAYNVVIENAIGGNGGDTIIGNQFANRLDGGAGNDSLTGGDGDDTLLGGSGNDWLYGNEGADLLSGGDGNDTLTGVGGDDTLEGGDGNDIYEVQDTGDFIIDTGGYDIVNSSTSFNLATNGAGVEQLVLAGSSLSDGAGNTLDNVLTGNDMNNSLDGGDGNDSISGREGSDTLGGGAGNDTLDGGQGDDTLDGGAGNDVYIVDSAGDLLTDSSGTDTVMTALDNFILAIDFDNLTLTGSALTGTGNAGDNFITGTAGADQLYGLDGADTLDGGAGADSLNGGDGNDTYIIDSADAPLIDSSGIDTVMTALNNYILGADFESLTLTGNAVSGTGHAGDNLITGNARANRLSGLDGADTLDGGAGADSLIGGDSNDIYVVDNTGDKIVELSDQGLDTVLSSVTYSLADTDGAGPNGGQVENLTLTGNANINATGSAIGNHLLGNDGNNKISGGSGNDSIEGGGGNDNITAGVSSLKTGQTDNDTVSGGDGNDKVTGDAGNDSLDGGAGNDTIDGGADNDLINGGAGRDSLTGGAGNDLILGDSGNDTISGSDGIDTILGGIGNDLLTGGKGDDIFIIGNDGAGADIITDFSMITSGKGAALITTNTDTLQITSHFGGDTSFDRADFEIGSPADGTKGVMINFSDGGGSVLLKNVSLDDLMFETAADGSGTFTLDKGQSHLAANS